MNPKTYAAFTKKTGVKVKKDFFASNEVLQAKLKAGARGYDLAAPTGYMVKILAAEKLLEPIDWSKLPTAKRNIDPKFKGLPFDTRRQVVGRPRTGGRRASCTARTWSRSGRRRWKQFFDLMKGKYSGKVTLLDGSPEVLGSIARMLGYSYNTEKTKRAGQGA